MFCIHKTLVQQRRRIAAAADALWNENYESIREKREQINKYEGDNTKVQ